MESHRIRPVEDCQARAAFSAPKCSSAAVTTGPSHRYRKSERLVALSAGQQIRKVPIDVDALVAWCRERRCRIDSAARAEYVTYLLQQGKRR